MTHEYDIPRVELRRPNWWFRALGVKLVLPAAMMRRSAASGLKG